MVMLLAPKKAAPKPHHPNKPEAGQAPKEAQAESKAQKASPPESTAVGSK
jgi:hypothetical protein